MIHCKSTRSCISRLAPLLVVVLWSVAVLSDDETGSVDSNALGLQCPPCERVHCSPRRPSRLRCRGGIVRGVCNCCPVCAKQEGDTCGGQWNYLGRCDAGLHCDTGANRSPVRSKTAARRSGNSKNSLIKTEGYCRRGKRFYCSVYASCVGVILNVFCPSVWLSVRLRFHTNTITGQNSWKKSKHWQVNKAGPVRNR